MRRGASTAAGFRRPVRLAASVDRQGRQAQPARRSSPASRLRPFVRPLSGCNTSPARLDSQANRRAGMRVQRGQAAALGPLAARRGQPGPGVRPVRLAGRQGPGTWHAMKLHPFVHWSRGSNTIRRRSGWLAIRQAGRLGQGQRAGLAGPVRRAVGRAAGAHRERTRQARNRQRSHRQGLCIPKVRFCLPIPIRIRPG